MPNTVLIPFESPQRSDLFESLNLEGEESLLFAVEAMVDVAMSEHIYQPDWFPLGARVAAGVTALRMATEGTDWFPHKTKNSLAGVKHMESGLFIAIHNTCERTGLCLSKGHPRFISARNRSATKSLRDDLQGDLFAVIESNDDDDAKIDLSSDLNLHLCVFILKETSDIGEQQVEVRAELIVGGECSNYGFSNSKFRVPLNLGGLSTGGKGHGLALPPEDDLVDPIVSIRKRS